MFQLREVKLKGILEIDKLELPSRQVSCIIGPSGAGKSTLLELLNNLLSVDKGEVFYKGQNIEEIDPVKLRQEVIMLPQKPVTFAGTIKDNLEVAFELTEKEIPEEEKLKEMLEWVHLNKSLSDKADNLSGGEKQRLSLARILLLNPEVLLLDEPSSALDDKTEDLVIKRVIEYIREKNKTLVMITHSRDIAKEYGDKIIEINNGRVVNGEVIKGEK